MTVRFGRDKAMRLSIIATNCMVFNGLAALLMTYLQLQNIRRSSSFHVKSHRVGGTIIRKVLLQGGVPETWGSQPG